MILSDDKLREASIRRSQQTSYWIAVIGHCMFGLFSQLSFPTLVNAQTEEKIPYVAPLKNRSTALTITETDDTLPKVPLSKNILYKIIASEIAIQRNNWQNAFITIFGLAQETLDPRLAKRATEIAMGAKQFDESLKAIELWRKLAPNSAEATQYYLSMMIVKNDFAEIQKHFVQELQLANENEKPALMHQAQRALARTKDKKAALASLKIILASTPTTIDSHIVLARGAYASENTSLSIKEAREALVINPASELAILSLAQALDKNLALDEVAHFLQINPSANEVRLAYGTMLIENKKFEAAKKVFEQLLKEAVRASIPEGRFLFALGAIELELSHPNQAEYYWLNYLKALDKVADTNVDRNSAYINLAQVALMRGNKIDADSWLAKVENTEGKETFWFDVQMRRALLMANAQQYKEARQFLQNLKGRNDQEAALLLQTEAQVMKAAGQNLEAFIVLQAALGDFPRNPELLYDFSLIAELLKHYNEMEIALKQLILITPNNAFAYNALGYSYADRNINLVDALKLIEHANQLSPEDPYILDSLGWVKFRLNQITDAENILRRSFTMRQDPDIAIHLGEILWVQNKKDEAISLFSEAKKKDADNDLLKTTMERLGVHLPR